MNNYNELPTWYSEPPFKKYKTNNIPVSENKLYLWNNNQIKGYRYYFYDSQHNTISGNIVTRTSIFPYKDLIQNTDYVGIGEYFINYEYKDRIA